MLTGFSDKQILSMLGKHSFWAKRACREALNRKEDFVPLLLEALDYAIERREDLIDGIYNLHIPAAYLLAQLREKRAYTRLMDLLKFNNDDIDCVWGDILPDKFDVFLRDTFNGDTSLLPTLIEDRSISPWARIKAMEAYGFLYADGHISREDLVEYLRRLINVVYAGTPDDKDTMEVLTMMIGVIQDHHLTELESEVKSLYDKELVDEAAFGDFDEWLAGVRAPKPLREDAHINDAIHTLDRWDWFTEQPDNEFDDGDDDEFGDDDDDFGDEFDDDDFDDEFDDDDDRERPVIRPSGPKPGRNDPCPCGSGKKYKHCHGR